MKWDYTDSLLYLLCKVKRKPIKCDDGSIVLIYKDPGDFLKEALNDFGLGIKLSFNQLGIPEIEARYELKPSELRARVDQVIEQTKLHMKALYETYSIRPCDKKNHELFQQSLLKVIDIGSILRTLKETTEQTKSLELRYDQIKELAHSKLKGDEVERAKKATSHSLDEYYENAPLEIMALIKEAEIKLDDLQKLSKNDKNPKNSNSKIYTDSQ